MSYLTFPITTDAETLQSDAFTLLKAAFPNWNPSETQLSTQMIEVIARMNAVTASVASVIPQEIFRFSGKSLNRIPSIDAARATVTSTWTLTDNDGHIIPQGALVAYRDDDGTLIQFQVVSDVTVPAGSTTTSTGAVLLQAVDVGTQANGLAPGSMVPIDAIAWLDSVTTNVTSAGGVDQETDAEYLNRLTEELQLSSPRPIIPNDFAVLARRIAGVGRSTAIDGYDAIALTYGNERTVTVAVAAEDGTALDAPTKAEVSDYLESLREINFLVYVIDPTYTAVNVTATVKAFAGQDLSVIETACEDALTAYLSPDSWDWAGTIYHNELVALLSNVAGVDRVIAVSTPAGDLSLSGVAALPTPGTLSVTAS